MEGKNEGYLFYISLVLDLKNDDYQIEIVKNRLFNFFSNIKNL